MIIIWIVVAMSGISSLLLLSGIRNRENILYMYTRNVKSILSCIRKKEM